jgi:hypothetical protein
MDWICVDVMLGASYSLRGADFVFMSLELRTLICFVLHLH